MCDAVEEGEEEVGRGGESRMGESKRRLRSQVSSCGERSASYVVTCMDTGGNLP